MTVRLLAAVALSGLVVACLAAYGDPAIALSADVLLALCR